MSEVKEITEQPDVKERAVIIYTMNRAYWETRFYDESYWERYLDMLAKDRINTLDITFGYECGGFMAPVYPYFFDVEGYPDVKMANVTPQDQQRNLETLIHLVEMMHERGIRFKYSPWDHVKRPLHLVDQVGMEWFERGIGGTGTAPAVQTGPSHVPADGVQTMAQTLLDTSVWVSGLTYENVYPYNNAGLAKFIKLIHPDMITLHINPESGLDEAELLDFGKEFVDVIKETDPGIPLDMHTKGLSNELISYAANSGLNVRLSTKYWMEQMGMPWHPTHIPVGNQLDRRHQYADLLIYPKTYGMFWKLWNGGTNRILLWGDPDYAGRFVESTHLYDGEAFGFQEPLGTKMLGQPHDEKPFDLLNPRYVYYDYEFERYWHYFQVFGRIGYNPGQSPDIWHKEFEMRFGSKAGPIIETALHKASWILPRIVAQPYPYILFPTTMGFVEKQRLLDLPTYAGSEGSDIAQFANFDEEAQILIEGGETAKLLPSMTSQWFEQTSGEINELIEQAEKAVGKDRNKEFNSTITDLGILSNLALYHSRRIPAAVSYRIFKRTRDVSALDKAIEYEKNAIEAWRQIVATAGDVYASNLKFGPDNKLLTGHWKDELRYLEQDLAVLEQQRSDYEPEGAATGAPEYKVAANTDNAKFFQVTLKPVTGAPAGESITINAEVSATAGVKWVRLRYRSVNQKEDYQTLEMLQSGDSFEATVPADQINPRYDFMYFIEVMDNNGNGKIYPDFNIGQPYVVVKLDR